jgi:hypothetical protein
MGHGIMCSVRGGLVDFSGFIDSFVSFTHNHTVIAILLALVLLFFWPTAHQNCFSLFSSLVCSWRECFI